MGDSKRETEDYWRRLQEGLVENPPDLPEEMQDLLEAVASIDTSEEGPDLPHDELRAWIPSYVQAEVDGLAVAQLYPEVQRHLELCDECLDDYLELLQLALAEEAGELPAAANVPVPNLSFVTAGRQASAPLPESLVAFVRSLAGEFFEERIPGLAVDVDAMVEDFFEEVRELGGRFDPQRFTGEGFNILAAIYLTTQRLADSLSTREIDSQAREQLMARARNAAQQVIPGLQLSPVLARQFPDGYAALVARHPAEFWVVVRSLHA